MEWPHEYIREDGLAMVDRADAESEIASLATENADLRKHLNEANDLAVRLGNENAELRGRLDPDALTICYMSGQASGDAEARAMAKRLRAANATLDALREAVPSTFTTENSHIWRKSLYKVRNILYPQPKEMTDEPD